METPLLIDTDVLIDYLRDYPAAVSYVEAQQERFLISVVTVAELYAGVREDEERVRLEQFLRPFEIIPLDLRLAGQGQFGCRFSRADMCPIRACCRRCHELVVRGSVGMYLGGTDAQHSRPTEARRAVR